ncbi:hypothetical protein AVEN_214479-1 [Araneus ventricosus]|uniref:Uncharacterized protein n=1 Tax=Araneus ventricosus TaxID=182803 RepID=A0A4Y2CVL5_ARAVE|nr:hypothetical protein AVEN_214479-1 [Araneus ventricosus]
MSGVRTVRLRLSGKNPCQITADAGIQRVYGWAYVSSDVVARTRAVRFPIALHSPIRRITHCTPEPHMQDAYPLAPRSYNQPIAVASVCEMKSLCKNTRESAHVQRHLSRLRVAQEIFSSNAPSRRTISAPGGDSQTKYENGHRAAEGTSLVP